MTSIIVILVALIVAAVISGVLMKVALDNYYGSVMVAGILLAIATAVSSLAYAHVVWSWLASESKANIINREYNTNYTREEIFYASSVIDTIRELDRKRFEVNGDLMRDQPDQE